MDDIKASKFLSLVLRHDPSKASIDLDKEGWGSVQKLIKNTDLTFEQIERVVLNNNKQRFAFNVSKTKIRANQGHSIDVDLKLMPLMPPALLYHGTATRFLTSIYHKGIQKQKRNHVHLSYLISTARIVGSRHGKCAVLEIDSMTMYLDGKQFYQSDNGVWLTDEVQPKYIRGLL